MRGLTLPGEVDRQYGTRELEGAVLEGTRGRTMYWGRRPIQISQRHLIQVWVTLAQRWEQYDPLISYIK